MLDIVDTALGYEKELIVCSILQDFSKGKGSSLQLIYNAHTAFLLRGAEMRTNDYTLLFQFMSQFVQFSLHFYI